jgi:hypothetical protein
MRGPVGVSVADREIAEFAARSPPGHITARPHPDR